MRRVEKRKQVPYHYGTMAQKKKKPEPASNPWPARLKKLRDDLNITQREAAERVRVHLRSWAKWEYGDQIPSESHQLLIEMLESGKV